MENRRRYGRLSHHSQDLASSIKSSTSSTSDQDLPVRKQLLLPSRIRNPPPETPCSTPDFILSTCGFDRTPPERFVYTVQDSEDTIDRAIAKLTQLKSRKKAMAILHFDGPNGQIEGSDINGLRTHPSQPCLDFDGEVGVRGTGSRTNGGLDQKTLDDLASGGNVTSSNLDIRANSKALGPNVIAEKHHSILTPRYDLPTITPAILSSTEDVTRSSLQHVPGSFRSEDAPINDVRPTRVAPIANGWSAIIQDIESWINLHDTTAKSLRQGSHNPMNSSEYNDIPITVPLIRHVRSQPSIRERISESTLQSSTTSIKSPRDFLEEPANERLNVGESDQSVVVTNADGGHPHAEGGLYFRRTAHPQIKNSPAYSSVTSAKASMPNLIPPRSSSENFDSVNLADHRTKKLIGDDPPLKVQKIGHPKDPVQGNLDNTSTQGSHSRGQFGTIGPELSPRKSMVSQRRRSKSDSDTNSAMSQKLSIFSEPLSNVSEVSLYPKAVSPMIGPISRHDTDDPRLEDSRVKRSLSLSSSVGLQTTNKIKDLQPLTTKPQSLPEYSHPLSTPHIPDTETTQYQSKRQWVRQLLGAISAFSMKSDMPNLTARPIRRQLSKTVSSSLGRRQSSSESIDPNLVSRQQESAESFSKIILDLEDLLKEALTLAKDAADKDEENVYLLQAFVNLDNEQKDPTDAEKGDNQTKDHIAITEHGSIPRQEGRLKKHRDATPYPANSVVQTSHASVALTAIPVQDSSDHAKELVALLGLPTLIPSLQPTVSESSGLSRSLPNQHGPQGLSISGKSVHASGSTIERSESKDWALTSRRSRRQLETHELLPIPQKPILTQSPRKEQYIYPLREHKPSSGAQSREAVHEYISTHHAPPVQPRTSSVVPSHAISESDLDSSELDDICLSEEDFSGGDGHGDYINITNYAMPEHRKGAAAPGWVAGEQRTHPRLGPGALPKQDTIGPLPDPSLLSQQTVSQQEASERPGHSLKGRSHFSVRGSQRFSLSRSHRRMPIARDWSLQRKRYVATVACTSTALLGLIVGIYAGEVPAIQYAIADEHHYTILGNVVFYIGLAIPTALFWPLPLLHGRKPYTLAALTLLLTLQFPQAMIVSASRSPYVANYRVGLLLSRAFAGLAMGFANINFQATLLDLFGSSLQSKTPHQETVNANDVRRHGGGMGLWLGIWTWCFIGSIGVGFLIGAAIINSMNVSWGFWITIVLTALVLVLNVMTPEVRRSSYRRSVAEVRHGSTFSRRIARGEVKMHLYQTGPKNWIEEVLAGNVLCFRMLKQPGFMVLALYMGWIYGQVIMIMVLLGALISKYYRFHSQYVGLCVLAISIGALLAIPFQKASWFSRSRSFPPRTDSMTFEKRVTWTTHLVRRAIFMIVLPFAGLAYTLSSGFSHTHFIVPTIFAGLIGFLSNLAIAECNGLIMETFDTSDLQPGMTGRPRLVLPEGVKKQRTNYSSFPRVTAGFAIVQTFAFLIAAAATGTGGAIERRLGAQTATAVVAGILLVLTLLLIAIVTRFKTVQVVPSERYGTNVLSGPEDEWKPIIIGNPSGSTRRMSLLELGEMARWTEIRRRNRLIG